MAPVRKVVLDEAAAARPEYWSQEVVGEANGSLFKVAKGTGATEWHAHADQDEVFVVTGGTLVVELRSGDVTLEAGEMLVVPRGVEHRPRAEGDARFLIVARRSPRTPRAASPPGAPAAARRRPRPRRR